MSTFSKTVIVDPSAQGYPHTIQEGVDSLSDQGGTVYVEAGEYEINTLLDTVIIPSNTTIIGRGNVIVKVTGNIYSFINSNQISGNDHITISGFKIVVACGESGPYNSHLIYFRNVSDCTIENITIDAPVEENPQGVGIDYFAILICSWVNAQNYLPENDCQRNVIRKCFIKSFGNTLPATPENIYNWGKGIGLTKQPGTKNFCRNTIVKNNYVSRCHANL